MINREDIVNKCMFNVELVTDDVEKAVAKVHLDQSGFDTFREELGTPKDTSLKRGNATLDVSYDEQDLMKEAESAEETSSETGSVHEKHTGSEAKGTSKAVPGDSKGSPISAAIGRIVRGSSKEKAAPRMAVEETFEEEPVLKTDSAEVTQHAAVETGPTAPPRDLRKKSKREKSPKPQGPDYSLPRIRDSITPERDFTSTTDAMTVSSIREAADASKEPATDGKLKKEKKKDKKDKKEKSPSPPGPDYTLPRLRDMYTPSDSGATAGYSRSTLPEEDMTPRKDIVKTFSFKRKSKERSLSPDLTRAGKNGSLGADFSTEEQEKRVQKSSEGSLVEKVEKVVKDTPGKIVEIVHIKRQRSSKSPEGTGSFAGKDKQRLPSSEVEIPDMATSLKDMSSDTSDAEKKHKEQKETSPLKQKKKDLKEVTEAVDKDVELSVSDGKSQDTGFLSKMAKLPKKMFPRSGKASASDEEPSSISESSPISKKKSGKFPKSATLPKASEKPSKKPIHEIKSVDVEVDTSKFTSKRSKDALAKDGEDLETSTGDIIKESDGKFFARMSKLPKKMFPRSSKTSSSEDEPSSASESISLSKQKAKKEPKVDATLKKKEKGIKIKQADTQTLPASIDVDISSHSSLPSGVDIGTKKIGKPELPDIEIKKKSKSINMPVPSGVDVAGSVEEAVAGIDISGIKSLPKELDFTVDAKHPDISSDVELSLTSKETTLEWPDKGEGTIETSTPGHGKLTKSGFMTKMAKIPKKMFPHSLKGDVSVEEMSAESIHASVPETQLTLDTDSEMIVSDTLPKELSASIPEGVEGSIELSAQDPSMSSEEGFISKVTRLPRKIFSHDSKDGISVERPSVAMKGVGIEFLQPELQIETSGKGIKVPQTTVDITLPTKKQTADLPDIPEAHIDASLDKLGKSAEPLDVHVNIPKVGGNLGIKANIPDEPQLDFDAQPGKGVSVEIPEGVGGRVEISHPGVPKPSDGGFMAKMAKLPKKIFPHGSKGSVSIEASDAISEAQMKTPGAQLKVGVKGSERTELGADIGLPDKEVAMDFSEGAEGKVALSTPGIGKMSDESFMSKMGKISPKIFPHGTKAGVSVEGVVEGLDAQVKMPEAHLKMDVKSPEKPEVEAVIGLPDLEMAADIPEGIEGKVQLPTPEMGKPSEKGFMSKVAKFPKKMFPHGSKGSVEGTPEIGDIQAKAPEIHLKMDVKGYEKPTIESDVNLPEQKVPDLPEGMEAKVEISKGEVSLESSLELVRDVQAELPDTHVKLHLKDEQPVAEGGILLPESEVTLDLAGGIEGKVEATTPEVGKSSDTGFVSKISKLPKKLLPHGKKAGTFFEEPIVTAESAHVDIPQPEGTLKIEAKLPTKREASTDIEVPAVTLEGVAGKSEVDVPEIGKASDKGFMSKMAKFPKKMFHHGSKDSGSTDEHTTVAEAIEIKMPEVGVELHTHLKTTKKPEADVSISVYEKEGTVKLPEGSKGGIEISTPKLVGEHVPDGSTQGADIVLPGIERPTMERRETKETPGGVVEVIEVTTHEVSKPSSPGLLSKVSKIPKKIFPRGSKSKSSDEESPSTPKRELKETPGGIVEVIEVTKHDVAKAPEGKRLEQDGTKILQPASPKTVASNIEGFSPAHMTREIKEVPGGVVEVVRVTKHVVGKLPEDKHSSESSRRMVDPAIPWEAELAKDPSAVVKREVKETPEGHVEVVQVIRREVGDAPLVSDFPGDGSDATVSRRIETTVVDGKPTIIRRLVTTTSDGIQQVTEHIEQGAEELGSTASSLFAKMGEFARGLSSDDPSALTKREVKKLSDGSVEVVSITKRSSSSPGKETTATERLPSSTSGSMHFVESAAGKPTEAKTAILRREISGPETILCTTSVVTSATTSSSSKPELSADVLDKMFGDIGKPKVDDRLKDVLTAEGGYGAKREVTPEEAELLAQLFPEQSSGVAPYPPAGLVPEAAIIPEYRSMMTTGGPPLSPRDPESKEKVLLKLGRALSQDDLDAPSPTRGEAAMTVAGLGEAVDVSDQVEEPAVEKLELARRESKRYSREFEQGMLVV
ncbi:hypothetical protein HPB51_019394 [Rhipicephalus microplus]|uniref:Uncharacterized protein n=1 Tax=Rhipicephalus microplus TaxID=6941 RepID=A0A9J6DB74_RHIMP|nr:hypothetical protein HPB51_019394 [Rhipicephalus microplus]